MKSKFAGYLAAGAIVTLLAAQASNDVIEGPKAFSEKRKPNWTGA